MNEANKIKLGAFVLVSVILLIAGMMFTGALKIFTPTYKAMTVLNTSVEGLTVGSPVKYLGLPVGKVTAMAMRQKDGYIAVYFELFASALEKDNKGRFYEIMPGEADMESIIQKKDLMCFLNAAGIMGGTYLELSAGDAMVPALPHLEVQTQPGVIYIPSRPSHIGNAIQNISRMLDELGKVNFVQMADKINGTMDELSSIMRSGELVTTLKNINEICSSLQKTAANLNVAFSEVNIKKVDRMINGIDENVMKLNSSIDYGELGDLIKNFRLFLIEGRTALEQAQSGGKALGADVTELKKQLEISLIRLDNTLKDLSFAAQNVKKDPSQFVHGRQEKELTE